MGCAPAPGALILRRSVRTVIFVRERACGILEGMKTRMSSKCAALAAMMLGFCLAVSAEAVRERDLPRGTRSLWNLKELEKAPRTWSVDLPCSNDYGRVEGVAPVFIEGEPWKGKPTRVFAWWGLPKGASAEKKVPAMVLVHGGGGTAFAKWVKTWNDRGYAAIAMDTCGRMPNGERDGKPHPTHPWSGPSGWGSSVAQVVDPVPDQWTYHAVAAVMRCHSFLRSRPEVQADRIGLTGISWGGYLTSIVMSVDDRFLFAAPVYGCGWYDLNPQWDHMNPDREKYRKWLALWDPKNYLSDVGGGGAKKPVLWCCGTNDRWYPLDAVRRSCNALNPGVPLSLSLKLRMPHGHPPAGDPKEIAAMADHFLKGGKPLVEVTSACLRDGKLHVAFDAHGRKVAKAELLATCSAKLPLMDRPWTATPVASVGAGAFAAPVPADAVMFFANVVTDDGLVASTRIFARADWGLVDNPRNPDTDWMAGRAGLFAHFLYGADMADRVAKEFDVPALVKQVVDAKADYLVLTLGQNTGWMCAPNVTYEKTAGYAPGARCCPRDIPGELAAALKPHGVKLLLYLPCQPPMHDVEAETRFGFPAEPAHRDRTVNRAAAREWAKVIEEWSRRYGDAVAGWWFDGAYRWIRFDDEIAEIYAAAVKRGNPHAVVAFNEGVQKPVRPWTQAGDYLAGEVNEPLDEACAGRFLGDRQWHVLTYCGKTWGRSDCRFSDAQWIAWMKPALAAGGAVTVDVHIDRPSGRLNAEQVAQMKRVFAAARKE